MTSKNFIGEWYGRRIYPSVEIPPEDTLKLRRGECPFLTTATGRPNQCVKADNSKGVCTITTTLSGLNDWIVCPYRALDHTSLVEIVGALFSLVSVSPKNIIPVSKLSNSKIIDGRYYIYFSEKTGGELSIPKSEKSPELSFDLTIFECDIEKDQVDIGRFAIYEIQTMDFHGTYKYAVNALSNALDLHEVEFPSALQSNLEWAGRRIEGPNLSNVFKRTFYQIALKFELIKARDCAGVGIGIPTSVWESWQRHLGKPKTISDGSVYVLEGSDSAQTLPNCWIFTLRPEKSQKVIKQLELAEKIKVGAPDLIKRAFEDVSDHIGKSVIDLFRARAMQRFSKLAGDKYQFKTPENY